MPVDVPQSSRTVTVKIIDTGCRVHISPALFVAPPIRGHDDLACPAFSFLIENEQLGRKVIFDLGVKKEWEKLPKPMLDGLATGGLKIDRGKDVCEVLKDGGVEMRGIESIIWSHHHFDHTGTPSGFYSTTVLVVGEGFKETYIPGYPTNENSPVLESEYMDRDMREIKFSVESKGLKIGGMEAFDYFHDGSFYLLHSPGHTVGHMCALARTTASPPTFILMGADTAHHGGEFRPSPGVTLPNELQPSPLGPDSHLNVRASVCPGSLFLDRVHPYHSDTQPFYHLAPQPDGKGPTHDIPEAERSVEKMQQFDSDDRVMVIIAHDTSLLDVMDFYPHTANNWKEEGWREKGRWKFLEDFTKAIEETA